MHRDKAGFDLGVKDYSHPQFYSMTLPHTQIYEWQSKKERKMKRRRKRKQKHRKRAEQSWEITGKLPQKWEVRLKTMATGENNGEDGGKQRGGRWAEEKFGSFRLQLSPACKMADKEKLADKYKFIYLLAVLRWFCNIYIVSFCNSAARLTYLAFVIIR